jgi:hypothetical protein
MRSHPWLSCPECREPHLVPLGDASFVCWHCGWEGPDTDAEDFAYRNVPETALLPVCMLSVGNPDRREVDAAVSAITTSDVAPGEVSDRLWRIAETAAPVVVTVHRPGSGPLELRVTRGAKWVAAIAEVAARGNDLPPVVEADLVVRGSAGDPAGVEGYVRALQEWATALVAGQGREMQAR